VGVCVLFNKGFSRRDFIENIAKAAGVGIATNLCGATALGQVSPPTALRKQAGLITAEDLNWQGFWKLPVSAERGKPEYSGLPNGPGTTNYTPASLAVRYRGNSRHLLIPLFSQGGTGGKMFGDIVEWQAPTDATLYTGTSPANAPSMRETRRWANWCLTDTDPNMQEPMNGVKVGGLYWDEEHGVLWYTLHYYYNSSDNKAWLAATQLLDTEMGGGYCKIGTRYGPWWYNGKTNTTALWRQGCHILAQIPQSARMDLGGRKFLFGTLSVTAVGGSGHFGPGMHAVSDFPQLSDPPNSVIPVDLRIADFTKTASPLSQPACRRNADYFCPMDTRLDSSAGIDPDGNIGTWCLSMDSNHGFAWVETPTKHGIVMFGREVYGMIWYGGNPWIQSPHQPGRRPYPDALDVTLPTPFGNGYAGEFWRGVVRVFNPYAVREVGLDKRVPWADAYGGKPGMRPMVYPWPMSWNIPKAAPLDVGVVGRPTTSNLGGNTAFWDSIAQQLIWIAPETVDDARPTIHVFTIKP